MGSIMIPALDTVCQPEHPRDSSLRSEWQDVFTYRAIQYQSHTKPGQSVAMAQKQNRPEVGQLPQLPAGIALTNFSYWLLDETGVTEVGAESEAVVGVAAGAVAAATGADVAAAVFGDALASAVVAALSRVRRGKNGVTSNGIFSRSATEPTGLLLMSSSLSFHGSSFTRPPIGSAATAFTRGGLGRIGRARISTATCSAATCCSTRAARAARAARATATRRTTTPGCASARTGSAGRRHRTACTAAARHRHAAARCTGPATGSGVGRPARAAAA